MLHLLTLWFSKPIFTLPPAALVENATDFDGALHERLVYNAVQQLYNKGESARGRGERIIMF